MCTQQDAGICNPNFAQSRKMDEYITFEMFNTYKELYFLDMLCYSISK